MTLNTFIQWLKVRGLLAGVMDFDVWANDLDGIRELSANEWDNVFGHVIAALFGIDSEGRIHLLVVESNDPEDIPLTQFDYLTMSPILVEPIAAARVRMTFYAPCSGEPGGIERWLKRSGLTLDNVAIV